MVGKYLVNLHLNKTICTYIINIVLEANENITICTYIINIVLEATENSVLEAFGLKRYTSPSFYMCMIECVIVSMFESNVNEVSY